MKYKQSKLAYIAKYLLYKWFFASMTGGFILIYDIFKYKRHSLTLNNKSIRLDYGVFTQNSRELPYRSIQGISVEQSVLGQMFNYGALVIGTSNPADSIVFDYVKSPNRLRQALQDKLSKS